MFKSRDLLYTTQNLLGCSGRCVLISNPSQATASASGKWSTLHFLFDQSEGAHFHLYGGDRAFLKEGTPSPSRISPVPPSSDSLAIRHTNHTILCAVYSVPKSAFTNLWSDLRTESFVNFQHYSVREFYSPQKIN